MIDTHMGVAILMESTAKALRAGEKMCCRVLQKIEDEKLYIQLYK